MKFLTRLAPSPTGRLHLGNAWSFLFCWLLARSRGGRVLLRIDDIDPQRSKPEFARAIKNDLEWLGLDWDDEISQSSRVASYTAALDKLRAAGLIYPCFCSRRELRQLASAPHIGDEGVFYPGTCLSLKAAERQRRLDSGAPFALRLACANNEVEFTDCIMGKQKFTKVQYGGDFALTRSDCVWSYQLASAVDDCELGISIVLRGRDLLPSTPRQIILTRCLGYQPPVYAHIPLLLDQNGERLAKRHASLALQELREQGAKPERVAGYLAFLAGMNPFNKPRPASSLVGKLNLAALPKRDIAINISSMRDIF